MNPLITIVCVQCGNPLDVTWYQEALILFGTEGPFYCEHCFTEEYERKHLGEIAKWDSWDRNLQVAARFFKEN